MIFKKRLESFYSRVAFIGVVLLTCALFVYQSLYGFAIAVVSDYRMSLSHDVLAQAALFFPGSPSVQSKFAESELKQIDRRLPEAEAAAMRAVVQSPYSFKYRAILAEVLDAEGKKAKAEQSFSEALRLGPGRSDLHWKYVTARQDFGRASSF